MSKKNKANKTTLEQVPGETGSAPFHEPDKDIKILALLLLAAFVLRVLFLGKARLWQDEMLLVMTSDIRYGVVEVFRNYWNMHMVAMAWMPVPALLQNVFMSSVSTWIPEVMQNPFVTRLPGVVLGVTGVAGVYFLTRGVYERFVSLAATLVAAATFYPVFYAREVHAYPMLLALSPWALHFYTRCLLGAGRATVRDCLILCGLAVLLAYTHLTAPMMLFAMGLIAVLFLVRQILNKPPDRSRLYQLVATTVAIGLSGVAVLPVFIKILGGDNPHLKQPETMPPWIILNDVMSKLFLGDKPIMSLIAWVVMFFGVYYVVVHRKDRPAPLLHLGVLLLGGLFILLAALRTQYLTARYFIVVTPVIMILIAAGFHGIAGFAAGIVKGHAKSLPAVRNAMLSAFIAAHLLVFMPPMYLLENKSVDYGSIAEWLNSNLKPGTPFLMESGYDLRFVGGYHPTPGLVPAAPYVHGPDPGEMDVLHAKQIDFMRRFPEAPFIESAHHGYNTEKGLWDWPHKNFRSHVRLSNDALRNLITSGIFPDNPKEEITDVSYRTDIYFNTWEDRVAAAREKGIPILFSYEGWQVSSHQVSWQERVYFRFFPGLRGPIRLHNISDGQVSGHIKMHYVLPGEPGAETTVKFFVGGSEAVNMVAPSGQIMEVSFPVENLPPGVTILTFTLPNMSSVKGFILIDAKWSPE